MRLSTHFKKCARWRWYRDKPKTQEERVPGSGVHAIIGMTGQVEGASALSVGDELAITLVNDMCGTDFSEISIDIIDGVQELNNILIGAARAHLRSANLDFSFGLPKTMSGILFATDEGPQFRNLGIIFDSDKGSFLINLSWKAGTATQQL